MPKTWSRQWPRCDSLRVCIEVVKLHRNVCVPGGWRLYVFLCIVTVPAHRASQLQQPSLGTPPTANPHSPPPPRRQVGDFGGDNRAGIDATLHRISAMRNRAGRVVGLTCRVGRAITGSAELVKDLIIEGHSILFLGRPGVGKV